MESPHKKVLFDGTAAQAIKGIKYHGGAEYAKFILRAMIDRGLPFDIILDKHLFLDPETRQIIQTRLNGHTIYTSSRRDTYEILTRGNYDTFYAPLPYAYEDYDAPATFVGVIHGLRRIESPWDRHRHLFMPNIIKRSVGYFVSHSMRLQHLIRAREMSRFRKILSIPGARFVTVSYHSKYSILNFFPEIDPDAIQVFYSPFKTGTPEALDHEPDYFLMVSGNRFEKNVYRAALTFDHLFANGRLPGKRVVITGTEGEYFWRHLRCRDRFELLPYLDQESLDRLYAGAFCFVYPSLNEGFGYPPLISMSYGVPVIASAATSIPEACGDAALFFPPTNTDDLANRILQIDNMPQLRADLRARGIRRVAELQASQKLNLNAYIDFIFT